MGMAFESINNILVSDDINLGLADRNIEPLVMGIKLGIKLGIFRPCLSI